MSLRGLVSLAAWALPIASGLPSVRPRSSSPTVQISNGTVEGVHSASYNQDYFLGLPFAQPPVGDLRFRVPQSLNTSFTSGTYSATNYSAACVGYGSDDWPYTSLSEDCLYLNVVRPSGYDNESLPVLFWIHGGGLTEGSGIDQRYNLSFLVDRSVNIGKPIIGVSINYRLSLWGFPTGDEAISSGNANLGFRDQRLALHWVQENIAAFGGDATKVTIIGESAGALSVGMQLTAYNGRDDKLFRGAVMESGNPINYGTFNFDHNALRNASTQLGGDNSTDPLEYLRTVPFDTLNAWINSTAGDSFSWKPLIDNDFIQGQTSVQLANGNFVRVPIIDGANSDEGTAFGATGVNTTQDFVDLLEQNADPVTLTPAQATKVLQAYPANITNGAVPTNQPLSYVPPAPYGAASRRSDAYYGDVVMIAHRRRAHQAWSTFNVSSYSYRFNTIPNGLPAEIGATHFQEVAFVFNNKEGLGYGYPGVSEDPFGGEPQSYFDLSDTMSGAWVSFVYEQNPGSWWPVYGAGVGAAGSNWVFDANVTGLGYVEKDDWRWDGIELINSWNSDVYNR